MSSQSPLVDPEAHRVLTYWFEGEQSMKKWFVGGPTVDAEIKEQFSSLVEKARASQLNAWKEQPKEALALIILLDQFPRNLFRETPLSYSSDPMARDIASLAIAKGFDRHVEFLQQMFFYLPFVHHENLLGQIAALSFFELMAAHAEGDEQKNVAQSAIQSGRAHLEPILKFGRFPSRNECLGRQSTPEEIEYLKKNPGFSGKSSI